jgi:hypothetical protein
MKGSRLMPVRYGVMKMLPGKFAGRRSWISRKNIK